VWIAATAGIDLEGARLPQLDDPGTARLRRRRATGLDAVVAAALEDRFDPSFGAAVAQALRNLVAHGPPAVAKQA